MSEQYVVVYTQSVTHNPLRISKGVYGPYDSLTAAQQMAAGLMSGEVYRLAATGCLTKAGAE